ncbi:MAG: PD40 domain-containing protein [Chloroflexi bacterium]|nr:PD40 domain-containing protein [Chloroflexota bacterium]
MRITNHFSVLILLLSLCLVACGDSPTAPNPAATNPTIAPPATSPAVATAVPATIPPSAVATSVPATIPPSAVATAVPATIPPPTATSLPTVTPAPSIARGPYTGKIVYDTADGQIFVVNPDGSGQRKVADGRWPLFSPDGTRVAFLTSASIPGDDIGHKVIINSVKLDGSDHQELCSWGTSAATSIRRWSSLGRFIVVNSTQQGPGWSYLCNVADKKLGGEIKTSQGGVAGAYDWTPDGNYAVWQASKDTNYQLYFGDPDKAGSGAVLLQPKVDSRYSSGGFSYYGEIRISPDGHTIAVGGTSLNFLSVPGYNSPLEGQTFRGAAPISLAWSPDGRALVQVDTAPGLEPTRVIHIQNYIGEASGGKTFELTQNVGGGVDWSRQ